MTQRKLANSTTTIYPIPPPSSTFPLIHLSRSSHFSSSYFSVLSKTSSIHRSHPSQKSSLKSATTPERGGRYYRIHKEARPTTKHWNPLSYISIHTYNHRRKPKRPINHTLKLDDDPSSFGSGQAAEVTWKDTPKHTDEQASAFRLELLLLHSPLLVPSFSPLCGHTNVPSELGRIKSQNGTAPHAAIICAHTLKWSGVPVLLLASSAFYDSTQLHFYPLELLSISNAPFGSGFNQITLDIIYINVHFVIILF